MRTIPRIFCCTFLIPFILIVMVGCTPGNNNPQAWINYPLDGTALDDVKPIQVVAHAADPKGIAYAIFGVDGVPYDQENPSGTNSDFAEFHFDWTPPGPGDYSLYVVVYESSGSARSKAVSRVHIGRIITETPSPSPAPPSTPTFTPAPTVTPTPTPTASETPLPEIHAKLVANRSVLDAGECVELSWWTENADQVFLDGIEVEAEGMGTYCPSETHTYQLVARRGTEEVSEQMTITVNEAGDTDPPPVPQPMVPADGLRIGCKAKQTLAWLPVSDPSGLLGYDVVLQQNVSGEWKSFKSWARQTDKQVSASVECGYEYRWRVRAVDSAGNVSGWSSWFSFVIELS